MWLLLLASLSPALMAHLCLLTPPPQFDTGSAGWSLAPVCCRCHTKHSWRCLLEASALPTSRAFSMALPISLCLAGGDGGLTPSWVPERHTVQRGSHPSQAESGAEAALCFLLFFIFRERSPLSGSVSTGRGGSLFLSPSLTGPPPHPLFQPKERPAGRRWGD